MLWPKFEDPLVAFALAVTGAISHDVLEEEEVACSLLQYLSRTKPEALQQRYKLTTLPAESWEMLEAVSYTHL